MAGFLVATALCLRAGPEPVRCWVLLALWLGALIAAMASRRRAAYVTLVLLGLLVVADHVAMMGGSGAVRRELDAAREGLARVRVAVQGLEKTATLETPLFEGGWAAIDTAIAREGGAGVVLFVGETPVAWSGDVPDGWSAIPKGVWVIGTRTQTRLAEMADAGPLTFLASCPVKLASRADTVVALDQNPFPLHLLAPEDHGSSTEWIYAALMLVLVLEILERRGKNQPGLALLLIGAGRLSLALSKPKGTLFGSDLFATSIPLLRSPGDLFATGIAFLLLASLLRRREADDAHRVPRVVAIALGSLAAASALGHLWGIAAPFCTIPLSPLELIATMPGTWAMIGASAAVFAGFALLVAWAPPPILGLGSIVWLAAGSGVPAGWLRAVPFLLFSVFLVRQRHLWTVVQSTGMVLAACCMLLPRAERLVAAVHRVEVERLAARLSFDERPWFRFLAREALGPCVRSGICLDEVWRRGPLGRFPATGQLLELNQSGQVVDRLTFGLRHQPAFEPATAGGGAQWEDVTEEIPPPRVVVNASAACAGNTVVVSLVADLLAPVSAGGSGCLADGTPWPGAVRFADRGLLSLQNPEGPAMGWRRESAGEVFRFQRELADGPHVADLALLRSNLPARAASFLAVAGMLCLTAAGALGLGRLWMVSSRHELFYRYRDRLLPLLLLVGTGPVVSLLAIVPSLERAAQDRDRRLET
ncbi:MAG: hypothetical protein MUE60_10250, partial [Candidatus Eisenbacteria bacterium]|nr:hypothetical protein [Candidatus Eisenbacteria bacterium]